MPEVTGGAVSLLDIFRMEADHTATWAFDRRRRWGFVGFIIGFRHSFVPFLDYDASIPILLC